MRPCFVVDTAHDFTAFIPSGGLTWARNDIDTKNTKRSEVTGKMYRKRLTTKRKLQVRMRKMSFEKFHELNLAIFPETITVKFLDPLDGKVVERVFYGSSIDAATECYDRATDTTYYTDISFSLIEA